MVKFYYFHVPPTHRFLSQSLVFKLQVYLKLDRLDLARKEYKKIAEKDEYATLAQLALAWLNLHVAGEKTQDAYFIFQELKDKFGPTPLLLNGQATCLLAQGRYEEAEPLLQECIDRDANFLPALINQLLLAQFTGKSLEQVNRQLNQLKDDQSEGNIFLADYKVKESEFDKLALQYAV